MNAQVHIGDFGKDLDDEVAAIIACYLVNQGNVDLLGTIANLGPAIDRARLAHGTYRALGHDIPVVVGTSSQHHNGTPKPYEFDAPYLTTEDDLPRIPGDQRWGTVVDGYRRITHLCDEPVTIVGMSAFTDVHAIVLNGAWQRVAGVVIMSGVETSEDGTPVLDERGYVTPNHTANNDFDYPAAAFLYDLCQLKRIPLTVVTRDAAMDAAVPADFYRHLAATGHPVGQRLNRVQGFAFAQMWEQVNLDRHDPARTLPWGPENNPRTPGWFLRTFCGGAVANPGDDIWPLVTRIAQYDSLAVLAATPAMRDRFFTPTAVTDRGVTVYGQGSVIDPVRLASFLSNAAFGVLHTSQARQVA